MSRDEARDQAAILRAQFDQFREAGKELASVMATYRRALVDGGCSEADALQLTIAYQGTLLVLVMQQHQNGDGE